MVNIKVSNLPKKFKAPKCAICRLIQGTLLQKGTKRENGIILEHAEYYCLECMHLRHDQCSAHFTRRWDELWAKAVRTAQMNQKSTGEYTNRKDLKK